MGMIYKRGNVWWLKYYRNGKPYRESSRSTKEADARRPLRRREGEISEGKLPGIYFDRIRFDELAEDFLRDYRLNEKKSLERAEISLNHLSSFFRGMRVTEITTPKIERYIEKRRKRTCLKCHEQFDDGEACPKCGSKTLKQGAENGTINRELSALKRILKLGAQRTPPKVDRVPYIPMLKENNVKQGFLEHEDFLSLRDALPSYLRGFVSFAYKTGWRISEITGLKWSQVDLFQGIVRLEAGTTKNDDARTFYLDEELKRVFDEQWEARKRSQALSSYVFPSSDGVSPIGDIRKAWNTACRKAGLGYGYTLNSKYAKKYKQKGFQEGPIFHDFRRTAVRNMVRAGVPERVAMTISGHKTRSVFDRYNIVSEADLKLASQKLQQYLGGVTGTISGTIGENGETTRGTGKAQVIDISGAGGRNRTDTGLWPTGF